jgi:CxxC-x17-CxxC domain-containing protein
MENGHNKQNKILTFGETTFRNQSFRFGIKRDDRRRHMYTIGKTGMGKSTLLENMIVKDIYAGEGVAVVDPHGDLAEKVMRYIPKERVNDVIYFNPADTEYPIAFNVVEQVEPELRYLVASGLIEVFRKLWADSWGPRLEYILRNTILAILDYPSATLLAVTRMLSDKEFRKKIVDKVQDPVVKSFWMKEFASYADKFATEAVSPIQNKVGQFLSSSLIRNIVGQVRSSIDIRRVMDENKILIMNLSKGRIGEDNSALLGAMMITKIQLAAMSRVNIPEEERRDFYLYIDEFQEFSTESFASILAEARKYRLNLTMSHQYIEQLPDAVKAAIFGNIGTLISFRVGATDAEELVKEFAPTFTEEDLVNIPKYEMYLKLMIEGVASDPFSARGLPPLTKGQETGNMEKAIKVSRERYTKHKSIVEDKIYRFHTDGTLNAEKQNDKQKESKQKQSSRNTENNKQQNASKTVSGKEEEAVKDQKNGENRAICYSCGKETYAPFKPDGIRPVYCKECLTELKNEKEKEAEERKKKKQEELKKVEQMDNKKKEINASSRRKTDSGAGSNSSGEDKELSLQEAVNMEPVKFNRRKTDPHHSDSESKKSKKRTFDNKSDSGKDNKKLNQEKQGDEQEGDILEEKDIYFS